METDYSLPDVPCKMPRILDSPLEIASIAHREGVTQLCLQSEMSEVSGVLDGVPRESHAQDNGQDTQHALRCGAEGEQTNESDQEMRGRERAHAR